MNIIEINNLTKDYGNKKGVFNINLEIKKGEIFGFLGPNGAGKTTTIRHIMGFIKPDSGTSLVCGLDSFSKAHIIQKDLGYIPGEITFMENMTGIEFIKFIAEYRDLEDLTKANELVKLYELDTSSKIKKMSKGMKQKLGIVVAFMHDPKILILDEPTSGLDPLMQKIFINMIHDEKKKGKTILMSSHIFEEIDKSCDKVAIIKDGKIVAVDEVKNLKHNQSKEFVITLNNIKELSKLKKEELDITQIEENNVTVRINNNLNELIKILSKYDIRDLEEKQLNLEEIFLNYYRGNND